MAEIVLARVDDRLIHGQIVNEWISAVNPTHLIIIDDDLVTDKFMSDIYRALIPIWLEAKILSVDSAVSYLSDMEDRDVRLFILARTPEIFDELVCRGVPIKEVSFADKMYFQNKIAIPKAYQKAMRQLPAKNVKLYAIQHPSDMKEEILLNRKSKKE